MTLRGEAVLVLGLGRSGQAAARLAASAGASVTALDLREDLPPIPGVRMRLGPHPRQAFLDASLIVVSPGVPSDQPDLLAAAQAGVPVVGEVGFAARFVNAPMVGITGTNGKSTVTHFVGHLLGGEQEGVFVGGNFGTPLSEAALATPPRRCVVELSSYQLERPGALRLRASAILNLTDDHLNRHGTMEAYAQAKCTILGHTDPDGVALIPGDDPFLQGIAEAQESPSLSFLGRAPGCWREGEVGVVTLPGVEARFDLSALTLAGAHNLDHAVTAATLALSMGESVEAIQARLPGLTALPHRMEPVGQLGGALWINDSKATNLASARVGIGGLDRPAVVLLGGQAKGPGFDALADVLDGQRAVVGFGHAGPQIASELGAVGVSVRVVPSLEDAMALASRLVRPGDAVLLSPATASFDAFRSFEHRGDVFRAWVRGGGA